MWNSALKGQNINSFKRWVNYADSSTYNVSQTVSQSMMLSTSGDVNVYGQVYKITSSLASIKDPPALTG